MGKYNRVIGKIFHLEKRDNIKVKEEMGILLYLSASIFSIVVGSLSWIMFVSVPFWERIKVISLIWILLGFIGIYTADYYLDKRDENALKVLFYVTLLNLISASSFFISALMSFVGVYFIYEGKKKKNKK